MLSTTVQREDPGNNSHCDRSMHAALIGVVRGKAAVGHAVDGHSYKTDGYMGVGCV